MCASRTASRLFTLVLLTAVATAPGESARATPSRDPESPNRESVRFAGAEGAARGRVSPGRNSAAETQAEHDSAPDADHGRHHREMPNLLGIKIGHLALLEEAEYGGVEYTPTLAVGPFYERVVRPGWLEVEITLLTSVTFDESPELFLPLDLHFKKPFHPSPRWSPYVGLGPALDVAAVPETDVFFGASLAAGTYLWFRPHWGLDLEVDYNVVRENGKWVHQILVAMGPVLRR